MPARPLPPPDYLEVMYPAKPRYPEPAPRRYGGQEYGYQLSEGERSTVARCFPVARTLGAHDEIVVLPSGHVVVRHADSPRPPHTRLAGTMRWFNQPPSGAHASYVTDDRSVLPPLRESDSALANRSDERMDAIEDARANGEYVNPGSQPRGPGRWRWLQAGIDDTRARERGLNSQEEVMQARQSEVLAQGLGRNAGPVIVWTPDFRFPNPSLQPRGPGQWEFLTRENEELARLNFGGREAFGLDNIPQPTARDILRLRNRLRDQLVAGERDEDQTEDVQLVWVPGPAAPTDDNAAPGQDGTEAANVTAEPDRTKARPEDEDTDSSASGIEKDLGFGIDDHTGLAHKPTNRGENNQTGDEMAKYQSRMLPDGVRLKQKYTVDRSVAKLNKPQPHKLFALERTGVWQPYEPRLGRTFNWTKKKAVRNLNVWRDQIYKRQDWPLKSDWRASYPQEQLDFIQNWAQANGGRNPPGNRVDWARDFNERFGTSRSEAAVAMAIFRAREAYNKKKNATAKTDRPSEQEDDDTEPPPKKQRRERRDLDSADDSQHEDTESSKEPPSA